jgi:hypothetical protein
MDAIFAGSVLRLHRDGLLGTTVTISATTARTDLRPPSATGGISFRRVAPRSRLPA